jgi:hypothetical protein
LVAGETSRALSISSLSPVPERPEPHEWEPLEFDDLLADLHSVMDSGLRFGYQRIELDRSGWGDQLDALRAAIRNDPDLKVIHIIGHGTRDGDGYLHLVPPGCKTDDRTSLQALCGVAQSACKESGRELLLVIDTCHAGAAVDQLALGQLDHIWVTAASMPDMPTYDGVFTKAFTATLNDIATGRQIGTDPSSRFVSMRTFIDRLGDHLASLDGEDHEYSPQAIAVGKFRLVKDHHSEIFLNPRFSEQLARDREAKTDVDVTLHEYLDERLDAAHFEDRVGAFFTGRRTILNDLGTWIADTETDSNLKIVTGSGGVGKSAVLGAIILTQHPQISKHPAYRALGMALRSYQPEALEHDLSFPVAAVHARQLRADDVTESFARQIERQIPGFRFPSNPSPDEFITAIDAMPEAPLLILDALDEAAAFDQITDNLLRGLLQQLTVSGGRPRCRLIVACRNETDFQRALLETLTEAATEPEVQDLDRTNPVELRGDLRDFLQRNLKAPIASAKQIATATAEALTFISDQSRNGESAAHQRTGYGAFLVATLFARYLQRTGLVDQPETALAQIPLTVAEVLEMDLADSANRSASGDRRAVLAALAFAKGQGMPASIVAHLAQTVFDSSTALDIDHLLRSGTDLKMYLRTAVDPVSSETLYRLFHQTLIDHLLAHPRSTPDLEALP